MQEKVQTKKRRREFENQKAVKEVRVEVKAEPLYVGIATTNINVDGGMIEKDGQVNIFEDKGDEWLTDKGLVSKLFLLLKKNK